jgi:hypothetical protein
MLAEVGEVLGDPDLRRGENVLEVADAEGPVTQEMEDAQAGFVAEAFVDFDQLHGAENIPYKIYPSRRI